MGHERTVSNMVAINWTRPSALWKHFGRFKSNHLPFEREFDYNWPCFTSRYNDTEFIRQRLYWEQDLTLIIIYTCVLLWRNRNIFRQDGNAFFKSNLLLFWDCHKMKVLLSNMQSIKLRTSSKILFKSFATKRCDSIGLASRRRRRRPVARFCFADCPSPALMSDAGAVNAT